MFGFYSSQLCFQSEEDPLDFATIRLVDGDGDNRFKSIREVGIECFDSPNGIADFSPRGREYRHYFRQIVYFFFAMFPHVFPFFRFFLGFCVLEEVFGRGLPL